MRIGVLGVCALGLLTAACGTNENQRAATGGFTGLGVGALVGGPVGAVVGGLAGAGGGTLAPEGVDQVANNLINREHRTASNALNQAGVGGGNTATASNMPVGEVGSGSSMPNRESRNTIMQAQQELKKDGLYHGRVDGIMGPMTQQALAAFQQQHNLQQTAALDEQTMNALNLRNRAKPASAAAGSSTSAMLSPDQVRDRLRQDGYSNVADLQRINDNTYAAHARKDGADYALQVDARTGRVVSQRQASSAGATSGSSAAPASGSASNAGMPTTGPANSADTGSTGSNR